MSSPIPIPWRSAGLPFDAIPSAVEASPDDRQLAIVLPATRTLRVIDMATGAIVSERRYEGHSVQWIGPDLLLCGRAPSRRIEIELLRVSSGAVLATWGADRRHKSTGEVHLGVADDGTCGFLLSQMYEGGFGWTGDFARIAISRDDSTGRATLEIVPIEIRHRAATFGHSAQTHTRRSLERRSGQLLIVHQASVNKPFDTCVVDLRTGTAGEWVETRNDLGPFHPVPRWVAPGLVLFGDVPRDFDGTKLWLTAMPSGSVLREALVPRASDATEAAQAVSSLKNSALHRESGRVYGVHSGSVKGKYCTRGWITDLRNDLRVEPVGIWNRLPETIAWIGDGVIGAAKGAEVSSRLPFWRNARDERPIDVAGPSTAGLFGYITALSTSPGGLWVMLRTDRGHAAWAPVASFVAT